MARKSNQPSLLHVEVRDVKGTLITNAKVTLRPKGKGKPVPLLYDDQTAAYAGTKVPKGPGRLEVSHRRLQGQSRDVTIVAAASRELFILGERGAKTYFREKVRVPVDADPRLFAVTIARGERANIRRFDAIARRLKAEPFVG